MRSVLICAYEFADPIFSGNGTHCRVLVEGLLRAAPLNIDVVCAVPTPEGCNTSLDSLSILGCPVSVHRWRRLDKSSDWEQYSKEAADRVVLGGGQWTSVGSRLKTGQYDSVLAVDWSGFLTLRALVLATMGEDSAEKYLAQKATYLNFRIFGLSQTDREFYIAQESSALRACRSTAVLSSYDLAQLVRNAGDEGLSSKCSILPCPVRKAVLEACEVDLASSPLPNELRAVAASVPDLAMRLATGQRCLVTCCVRLSSEKEPHRFVSLIKGIKGLGYTPLILGSVGEEDYAQEVKTSLRSEWGPHCAVLESFVNSQELATIFRHSLINIHPCSYDAFALTITEAAVCGCPTAIIYDTEGSIKVGATDLLGAQGFIPISANEDLAALLQDTARLEAVAKIAKERSSSYDTDACGRLLANICKI